LSGGQVDLDHQQPNDAVRVLRFDKPGRIVRIDHRRNLAVVSLGLGQWEVPLDEVYPLPAAQQ
jgi:DNA mismatch repair protein MutS2